ncbi:MAG TPA: hypothetical protein VK818_22375 [Methylomirabilota bacterium]|nr:hypothetical protein [Methylomirabilota bacterium]
MIFRTPRMLGLTGILLSVGGITARATELKPDTAAAFDRYVRAMEARMDEDTGRDQFLVVDRLPEARRTEAYAQLKNGQVYIEAMSAREGDRPIKAPSGLIHHWAGVIFIPRATFEEVEAVMRDYDCHEDIYKPQIRKSKLIERNGDESKVYFQFFNRSIVTVILNANFDVRDTQFGSGRFQTVTRSTRIAEVENVDSPNEHERPVGNDHGYMWRLFSYWRIEEKDGGVYVQNESVSLTRTVPALLAFIVNPLVKSIPRSVLVHLLTDTRNAVEKAEATPAVPATEPPKKDGMGVGYAEISGPADAVYTGWWVSHRRGLRRQVFG